METGSRSLWSHEIGCSNCVLQAVIQHWCKPWLQSAPITNLFMAFPFLDVACPASRSWSCGSQLLWPDKDMVVVQNSFFSKRPFLAKKNYFSQTFAILTKNFRGPYVGLYLGIFIRKQKLDKGHLRVWATIKTHSVAAAHSRVAFCF